MSVRVSTAFVIRHLMFEDPGLLTPLLEQRGKRVRILEPGVDDLSSAGVLSEAGDGDLLVVLGGPVGVGDAAAYPFLADEIASLREWIAAGRPVLGICLGAQLLAAALGARVRPTGRKEIGFSELEAAAGEVFTRWLDWAGR